MEQPLSHGRGHLAVDRSRDRYLTFDQQWSKQNIRREIKNNSGYLHAPRARAAAMTGRRLTVMLPLVNTWAVTHILNNFLQLLCVSTH